MQVLPPLYARSLFQNPKAGATKAATLLHDEADEIGILRGQEGFVTRIALDSRILGISRYGVSP